MQLVTMLLLATRGDLKTPARAINGLARRLGPGLITGAADDDPSGIATYSQAGSQFRFGLVWTLLLTTPLMIGIQMLSARIGWVTGKGLAANIAKFCPRWLTVGLVGLLVVANTINIAADIGAMGEAVRLLAGGPRVLYLVLCISFSGRRRRRSRTTASPSGSSGRVSSRCPSSPGRRLTR